MTTERLKAVIWADIVINAGFIICSNAAQTGCVENIDQRNKGHNEIWWYDMTASRHNWCVDTQRILTRRCYPANNEVAALHRRPANAAASQHHAAAYMDACRYRSACSSFPFSASVRVRHAYYKHAIKLMKTKYAFSKLLLMFDIDFTTVCHLSCTK